MGKGFGSNFIFLYFTGQAINAVADKEWIWIVDPVDGTTNYVYSLPLSVVSICVAQHVFYFLIV